MAAKLQSIFESLGLKYLSSNDWSQTDKQTRKTKGGRYPGYVEGVEARRCPPGHLLAGEYGLFATKRFEPTDVLGEYVGIITEKSSAYCAELHYNFSKLGVDSEREGNELRFMNDYHGIAEINNVNMQRCYIGELPRVLIVCEKVIEVGDEILTSYGQAYIDSWILKKCPASKKQQALSAGTGSSSGKAESIPINPFIALFSDYEGDTDENTGTAVELLLTNESSSTPPPQPEAATITETAAICGSLDIPLILNPVVELQSVPVRGAGGIARAQAGRGKTVPDTVYSHCDAAILAASADDVAGGAAMMPIPAIGAVDIHMTSAVDNLSSSTNNNNSSSSSVNSSNVQ